MHSLTSRFFSIVLGLSIVVPACVFADDSSPKPPKTKFLGSVVSSALTNLAVGDKVEVTWTPVVGQNAKMRNKTQSKEIKCTVTSADPAPSHTVVCQNTITSSTINPMSIAVGSTTSVEINFSPGTVSTSCGATLAKRACLRFLPSGFSVVVAIDQKIEAKVEEID